MEESNGSSVCNLYKKYKRNGVIYIKCIKNLWGVSGTDLDSVNLEAKRYFVQYLIDGEYDDND